MSKLIIPMSKYKTLADDDCDVNVSVRINVVWKNKSLDPNIETARISINAAFGEEARQIEKDLREIIKSKPAPEIDRSAN